MLRGGLMKIDLCIMAVPVMLVVVVVGALPYGG
jgi:hypothetical protein